MKITTKWINDNKVCQEAKIWYNKQNETDFFELVKRAKKIEKPDWINWVIARKLKRMDRIKYSIYAAEQVISNFEKEYPKDKIPREAIQAAKIYLKKPSVKNKEAAYSVAYSAAGSAAYAAAYSVVNWEAYWEAYWEAFNKMLNKIINYGLKILKGYTK